MFVESVAIGFGLLFLALLALLHFLKPELDPKWRMISEYEIGRNGWLMRIAFFFWAGSIFSLLVKLVQVSRVSQVVVYVWLAVIGLCLMGAGAFKTDPIMEVSNSFRNKMHTLCGMVVILTFPVMTTIACVAYSREDFLRGPVYLVVATVLTWMGMLAFFASIAISRRIDPTAGRNGPTVYLGWPNRAMVLFYVVWIFAASVGVGK